ncbi:MAG TPA: helix-hairpin-helix domain-containing protein [Bdellovibrionota bacterium]|nr:helix-hairpin-helix domain-containing protein [Bdellovibrionota bacterium]
MAPETIPSGAQALTELKGVGPKTAEKIVAAGYPDANALAQADVNELAEKSGMSVEKAKGLIDAAKALVG